MTSSSLLPSPFLAALVFSAFTITGSACAGVGVDPLTEVLNTPGSAGLGFITQAASSPYKGGGIRFDLLPLYLYEGETLFLRANRGGIKIFSDNVQRLDLFLEQRLEGFPVDRLPSDLSGMANRANGFDLGLSYRNTLPWGTLRVEWLHDAGNTSKGNEARLGYSYQWRSGSLSIRPSLTFALRDAKLNNYYYGVRPDEARFDRSSYSPGSGVNTTLGFYSAYDLTQRWQLLGGVSVTSFSRGIKASPIVEKATYPAVYLGAAYNFGGHQRESVQVDSPTYFKALYGRATEDGCHLVKILTARCLATNNVNPSSIAGIQIGKPFIQGLNGWPLDFVGYVGLIEHRDRGLQSNGLQLDLFMKAYYSGFPWHQSVKTRLGVGIGLSAVQRVPYAEIESGKTGSRLLNYLDPTLDVSLGDLIGSRVLKNTFIGVGVSHRSGIFGTSSLLGNVNGGSNYIYTYLETAL
jgi:outer membrane protein